MIHPVLIVFNFYNKHHKKHDCNYNIMSVGNLFPEYILAIYWCTQITRTPLMI